MTEDDRDLLSRVRTSIDTIDVPARSSDAAKQQGQRRRRAARVGIAAVTLVLGVALVGPLVLLSGLGRQQHAEGPSRSARPVPPANCPDPIPSPQPSYTISCTDAVKQAWEAAAYLQTASSATARESTTAVAENYSVSAWAITFTDARYVAGVAGCQESGTLGPEAAWVISDASGRLLGFPTRPHGCIVEENPTPIPLTYAGNTYTDPAGWQIDVPYGWLTAPVDITTADGAHVHGLQIMNPIGLNVLKAVKEAGSPARSNLVGTYEIGAVIATDTDPNAVHAPLLVPPISLTDFAHQKGVEQNGPGNDASLDVAWVQHADGRDISITAAVGIYAIPDDQMLLRDMLATFRFSGASG
jgi:hypothetical protein